jgi:hypothetical protein
MKIINSIKQFLHLAPRSTWKERVDVRTFGDDSVFKGAKTWIEDEVIPEHSLAPGKSHDLETPGMRETRQRVVLRNGTVLSGDVKRREVSIQAPNANPIILSKAALKITNNGVQVTNRDMRQTINSDGSYTLEDLRDSIKHEKTRHYRTYTVAANGQATAQKPESKWNDYWGETRFRMLHDGTGQENAHGYIQFPNKLVAPLVAHRYIINAQS